MKKRHTLLLLLPLLMLLLSCDKDDDKPADPVDQLPPATQTGANTAGCLVNGEPFTPKGYIASGNLAPYYDGENFTLGIKRRGDNNRIYSVFILLHNLETPLVVNDVIELNTDWDVTLERIKVGVYTIGHPPPIRNGFKQRKS